VRSLHTDSAENEGAASFGSKTRGIRHTAAGHSISLASSSAGTLSARKLTDGKELRWQLQIGIHRSRPLRKVK